MLHQPGDGVLEEDDRPFVGQPGALIQPARQAELPHRRGEFRIPILLTNLLGMLPFGILALQIAREGTEIVDAQLASHKREDGGRHSKGIGQKIADKANRTELEGKTEPMMAPVPAANKRQVGLIQMEKAGELAGIGITGVGTVGGAVFIRQNLSRHRVLTAQESHDRIIVLSAHSYHTVLYSASSRPDYRRGNRPKLTTEPCLGVHHTMIDAFIAWLRSAEGRRPLTTTTLRDYERHLTRFQTWLTDALGLLWRADVISEHRMAAYLLHLQGPLKRAPATQHKAVAVLRVFGAWLVETNQCAVNPARGLRAQPEQISPPKALAPQVIQRVIDAAYHTGDLRDAVVIELLASSGMRANEVASIQLEQLERGERTMWIRITGKGAKVRRLPLPKHVGLLIDQYLAARSAWPGARPCTGPLLLGQRGGLTRTTINDIVAKVVNRATLTSAQRQQVTPHAFRHTVATALVRRRDLVVADILGHTNINTTRRYAKASAVEMEAAINEVVTGLRWHTEESE